VCSAFTPDATSVYATVLQASNGYVPSEYTGGAAQNEQYIGFLRQIRHWIDNGWQGVLHLTSPGNSG